MSGRQWSWLVLAVLLSGCDNGQGSAGPNIERPAAGQTIPDDYFAEADVPPPAPVEPPPPPPPPPAPPPLPPPPPVYETRVEYEGDSDWYDPEAEAREALAAEEARRAELIALYRARVAQGPQQRQQDQAGPAKDPEYLMEDKDYTSIKAGADVSTWPVDRQRMVPAGSMVPAITMHSINSQLGGLALLTIERQFYGADGRKVIFPKGSTVLCRYKSLGKQGNTRLPVSCDRLTRPDGASVMLTKAAGADQSGRTGFVGVVDTRWWDRYGDAFVLSGLSVIAGYGRGRVDDEDLRQGVTDGVDRLTEVTADVIRQNLDLAPVTTVSPGSRVLLVLETDLWLKEPQEKGTP